MELKADFSLVVGGEVSLLHKFVVTVREGTLGLELALAVEHPVPAHLSPELYLVLLHEVVPLLLAVEVLLGFLHSTFFIEFIRNYSPLSWGMLIT